ncbi:MAG: sensor histidine kinase [Candidatus Binatia bacterium]
MRLRFPKHFHKKLSVRLTLWYSVIFILSSLTFSIISYVFVFSVGDNRGAIQATLSQYKPAAEDGGIEAVEALTGRQRKPSRRNSFFIRLVGPSDEILFLSNPQLWKKFDLADPPSSALQPRWHYYTSKRDGDLLEVTAVRLSNGNILQVGKSIRDREEVLERFRETSLAAIIPMIMIGLAGGALLAFRALRPVRNLSLVARSIIDTGRFDTRVPDNRSGDELNDLVVVFNQMLSKIKTLIEGMKNSLDNVAHDLRTPIMRVRIVAEEALAADDPARREALSDCLEETERLTAMLDTLMDISEAETGAMKLSMENVDLAVLIDEVVELYDFVAEDKGVTVSVKAARALHLPADRSRLRQVIANLVDNAIKYTPRGGRVEIESLQEDDQAVLLVRDTGVGIPPNEVTRIWDRLYRGDKSRSQRGLGLGLSFVKAVIEAHRGRVEVSTNSSGGSRFSLYLPLSPAV